MSDVDSPDLAITINTLPVNGLLQYYDGLIWSAVIAGQRIVKADIEAGFLCFGPDANESGFDGYSTAGTGNLLQDYASFTYQADDSPVGAQFIAPANQSDIVTMTINIIPVADAPALMLAGAVDAWGATALRFRTGWESASNHNPTSTVLPQITSDLAAVVGQPSRMASSSISELEGWRGITLPLPNPLPGGEVANVAPGAAQTLYDTNNHFIVWSNGDKMKDATNTNRIVYAASPLSNSLPQAGERTNEKNNLQSLGNNWIELADGQGNGHETWGIERTVDTRAGVA